MMDDENRDQQAMELETLEAMYGPGELAVASADFPHIALSVRVRVELPKHAEDVFGTEYLSLSLGFTLPREYPGTAPVQVQILKGKNENGTLNKSDENSENEENDEEMGEPEPSPQQIQFLAEMGAKLQRQLDEEAAEAQGMPAIFSLVSYFQDAVLTEATEWARRAAGRAEEDRAAAERAEHARFEGTRVTVESFQRWRDAFVAEMAAQNQKKKEAEKTKAEGPRLTGKQMFLAGDQALDLSDLQFLEIADDDVVDDGVEAGGGKKKGAQKAGEGEQKGLTIEDIDASLFEEDLDYIPGTDSEEEDD